MKLYWYEKKKGMEGRWVGGWVKGREGWKEGRGCKRSSIQSRGTA